MQSLPLHPEVDYSGSKIADGEIPEITSVDVPYNPITIYFPSKSDSDKWFDASVGALGSKEDTEKRTWSASVRVHPDEAKFRVTLIGDYQYQIGGASFTPLPADEVTAAAYDWMTSLITVCFEECRFATAIWPKEFPDGGANIAFIREKFVDVGRQFKVVYVAPGTVVGIDKTNNELERSDGGFAYDDRPLMESMAKQLYHFYSTPRKVLFLEKAGPTKELWLGSYVKQLGAENDPEQLIEPIGTVVTEVNITFPNGRGDSPAGPPVQTWQTAQGELDALVVAPRR